MTALVERSTELQRIARGLPTPAAPDGTVVVLEGSAGIGKTALLDAAAARAREAGVRVLRARGGEYEHEFAYGVVRQLFEPAVAAADPAAREQLLEGAAALSAVALGLGPQTEMSGADAAFAANHGIYWLLANLAARQPLLVVVDDAQWADVASLRCLLYLARRLDGVQAGLLIGLRTGEPTAAGEVLAALRDLATDVVAPGPLTVAGTGALLARELGDVDETFCQACHAATGGNPFLLGELIRAVVDGDVDRTAAGARRIPGLSPASVARSVLLRLSRLGAPAVELARALAVLEGDADLALATRVAGCDPALALGAAEALAAADIVSLEHPVRFRHPILRTAVYEELSALRREHLHQRAAELLAHQDPDRAATHLLATGPGREPWAGELLLAVGRRTLARGAPEEALELLDRALAEPLEGETAARAHLLRGRVHVELARMNEGLADLRRALELADDLATVLAATRASFLAAYLLRRLAEARETAALALAASDDSELRAEVETFLAVFDFADQSAAAAPMMARLRRLAVEMPAEYPVVSVAAGAALYPVLPLGHQQAQPLIARARRAAAVIRDAPRDEQLDVVWHIFTVIGLLGASDIEAAEAVVEAMLARGERDGSVVTLFSALGLRSRLRTLLGQLREAEVDAREALRLATLADAGFMRPFVAGYLVSCLVEQGRSDAARQVVHDEGLEGPQPAGVVQDLVQVMARAHLLLLEGRAREAYDAMTFVEAVFTARGAPMPPIGAGVWASVLHAVGRVDEARAVGRRLVDDLAGWPPEVVARAKVVAGRLEPGDGGISLLREALTDLEGSRFALEEARAAVGLGAALRRANRRAEATPYLRSGMDLAHRCGALGLVEEARTELLAAGARPRRVAVTGLDALTPSERRVATLAAQGMGNFDIAQALFVTRKTVEVHMSAVLRKLEVTSRDQIPPLLDADGGPSPAAP